MKCAAATLAFGVLSIALLWFSSTLFMQNNRFPASYHPDEGGKAEQIATEKRNFNHPQLMLESAIWLLEWRGQDPKLMEREDIVFAGRDASAYLAGGAVVLLAWAGFFAAGWRGFALAAVGAALCPTLLSHARYFKEEPSLCLGVAAVICAGAMMCRLRHWGWQLPLATLLGVAVALAASGKYAGAVMVLPAIVIILLTNYRRWWLVPFLLLLMVWTGWQSWQSINWRAMENWDDFVEGFEREQNHAVTDHVGLRLATPTPYFFDQMIDEAMPHVPILVLIAPAAWVLTRRRKGITSGPSIIFMAWLGLTIIVYTVGVSYSVIPFFRYIMPASLLLYVFAAVSVLWWIRLIDSHPIRQIVTAMAIIALAWVQTQRVQEYDQQFALDSRDLLYQWARKNVPPGTVVVADGYTEWNRGRNRTRADVTTGHFAASRGSIERLRSRGVKYVAIAGSAYERFLDPHTVASEGNEREFAEGQRFYNELINDYPVVWARQADHPMQTFTNPNILVFQIRDAAAPRPTERWRRRWW